MQLRIKQRVFSWSDTYDVYDENEVARYFVKAEVFSFGHQIHVYEKVTGKEVGSIHEELFTFLPKFEIVIDGRSLGMISRKFSFLHPHYQVDFMNWEVEGDFLGWDYSARQNGAEVLSVSRELLTWGDTYMLRYDDPANEIPGLLLVLAIDAANCKD